MSEKESLFAGMEPTEKGKRAIERLKERFNIKFIPDGITALSASECGIQDIYMNLKRQLADGKVEEKTKTLVALGVASSLGSAPGVEFFSEAAVAAGRTCEEALDAVSVATTCSVFNGYYRFRHQLPADLKENYEKFKAPFNANSFMKSSLSSLEVEAICIAVSSVQNCEMCVNGHIQKGKSAGLDDEQIDELIKVGATAGAAAQVASSLAPEVSEPVEP